VSFGADPGAELPELARDGAVEVKAVLAAMRKVEVVATLTTIDTTLRERVRTRALPSPSR
jgi:hypothetical protein